MMNVVGRVGNLISQGVLAIAVPFHPFGGAIDVIVVQQRDGTFRTTPWHVQFGKFQGVLKGSKKVRITVNGVEADFHMHLDRSGEAYFIREVDTSEGSDGVNAVDDSILDDRVNGDGKNNGSQDVVDSCIQDHGGVDTSVQMQDELNTLYSENEEDENTSTPSGNRWSLWPIPFRRVKKYELNGEDTSFEVVFLDTESEFQSPTLTSQRYNDSPRKRIMRTHIPTTEQIASLNLKEGQNRIEFTFPTKVLGVQKVDAHIYLWKWNARIVISDVDGTITKSDVLGQFMPLVGMDWTQSGVARLFSAIKDGEALPDGPVLISPDGLFPSLYREVIRRAPHEFKIACLEEIRRLFPSDHNPFYAGFGNRDTDDLSYMKMGIPKGKIFIINPKGEVMNSHSNNAKSYKSLLALVNEIFPPASPSDHNPCYTGFGNRDTNELSDMKMGIPKGKIFIINPKGEVMNCHSNNARSYKSLLALVNQIFPPASSNE